MKTRSSKKEKEIDFEIHSLSETQMNQKIADLMNDGIVAFSHDSIYSSPSKILADKNIKKNK